MSLMMKPGLGRPRAGPSDVTRRDLENKLLHQNLFAIVSHGYFGRTCSSVGRPRTVSGIQPGSCPYLWQFGQPQFLPYFCNCFQCELRYLMKESRLLQFRSPPSLLPSDAFRWQLVGSFCSFMGQGGVGSHLLEEREKKRLQEAVKRSHSSRHSLSVQGRICC